MSIPAGLPKTPILSVEELQAERAKRAPLTLSSITGPETEHRAAYLQAEKRILSDPDAHKLLDLSQRCDGSFLYLVETRFATFPKFVLGNLHKDLKEVTLIGQFGAEWNARAEWDRRRFGKQPPEI